MIRRSRIIVISLGDRIAYGLRRIDRLAKRSAIRSRRPRKLGLGDRIAYGLRRIDRLAKRSAIRSRHPRKLGLATALRRRVGAQRRHRAIDREEERADRLV